MGKQTAFDKNTVEFVTVAAEYCAFLEQVFDKEPVRVVDVLSKLLPLVYLKAAMLAETEPEGLYLEEIVSEPDYDAIRLSLQEKFGENDDYLEVFVEDMRYSDTPVRKCISEDLADIYQALKNFVHSYRSGLDEVMDEAVAVCSEGFRTYWGQTLVNTMRAVHSVRYSADQNPDDPSLYD
ncbi:MAG: DUF5063 domain-containing protein [Bacteroidaceae bacterium]|nr:DUF5063 domain-containing protein [Bacteroidaceae bacterium]